MVVFYWGGGSCPLTFFRGPPQQEWRRGHAAKKEFRTCFCHILFSYVTHPENRCVIILGRQRAFVFAALGWVGPSWPERLWSQDDWRMWVGVAVGSLSPLDSAPPHAAQSCCGCVSSHFRHTGSFPRKSLVVRRDARWGICALLWNFTIDVTVGFRHWHV